MSAPEPSPMAAMTLMTAQRAASQAPAAPTPPAPRSATRTRCSTPPDSPPTVAGRRPSRSKRGARESTLGMRPSVRRRPSRTSTSAAFSVPAWARPTAQSGPTSSTRHWRLAARSSPRGAARAAGTGSSTLPSAPKASRWTRAGAFTWLTRATTASRSSTGRGRSSRNGARAVVATASSTSWGAPRWTGAGTSTLPTRATTASRSSIARARSSRSGAASETATGSSTARWPSLWTRAGTSTSPVTTASRSSPAAVGS